MGQTNPQKNKARQRELAGLQNRATLGKLAWLQAEFVRAKANSEVSIAAAQAEADKIVAEARKEASQIVADAQKREAPRLPNAVRANLPMLSRRWDDLTCRCHFRNPRPDDRQQRGKFGNRKSVEFTGVSATAATLKGFGRALILRYQACDGVIRSPAPSPPRGCCLSSPPATPTPNTYIHPSWKSNM